MVTVGTVPLLEIHRSFIAEYYIYIETSGINAGHKATIASPTIPVYTASCLEFYYHMYGSSMGTLRVRRNSVLIFQRSGTWKSGRGEDAPYQPVNVPLVSSPYLLDE